MGAAHLHPHLQTLMSIPRTCILAQTLAQKRLNLHKDHEDYEDHKDYEKTKTSTYRSDCLGKSKAQDPSPLQVAPLSFSHNSQFLFFPTLLFVWLFNLSYFSSFCFCRAQNFQHISLSSPFLEEASISSLNFEEHLPILPEAILCASVSSPSGRTLAVQNRQNRHQTFIQSFQLFKNLQCTQLIPILTNLRPSISTQHQNIHTSVFKKSLAYIDYFSKQQTGVLNFNNLLRWPWSLSDPCECDYPQHVAAASTKFRKMVSDGSRRYHVRVEVGGGFPKMIKGKVVKGLKRLVGVAWALFEDNQLGWKIRNFHLYLPSVIIMANWGDPLLWTHQRDGSEPNLVPFGYGDDDDDGDMQFAVFIMLPGTPKFFPENFENL